MDIKLVVKNLKRFAPTFLAGSWDNVGLLVLPPSLCIVSKMLLTIDLTESVMDEAEEKNVDFILSYHPPIFKPLKTITTSHWKERIVGRCLENKIAIYSPHTSYDALEGGVNDWLIKAFGDGQVTPIEQSMKPNVWSYSIQLFGETDDIQKLLNPFDHLQAFKESKISSEGAKSVTILCTKSAFPTILSTIESIEAIDQSSIAISLLTEKVPVKGFGMGRKSVLYTPLSLNEAVKRVKEYLNLPFVRLAIKHSGNEESLVQKVAVCAGSGSSLLRGINADLYLTGEMSHHEVLEATHQSGASVILTDHSNSERGFLKLLLTKLEELLSGVEILISEKDADPLRIV